MTTYRLPPRGPQDLNILIALTWLKDSHEVQVVEDSNANIWFMEYGTKRKRPAPADVLAACIDGGWAEMNESGGLSLVVITDAGRYQAQRFQKINKL